MEGDGAAPAGPPSGGNTDGAAPSVSKKAAKKAAKARAKADAKAKARLEKGLDPNPPPNPRQRLVPMMESKRAALAGTKRAAPEPDADTPPPDGADAGFLLPKSAIIKRTTKDNEIVAEEEEEYYDWLPVDPDYYRNEPVDDDDDDDDDADGVDDPTLVDPRPTWMRRKQRAMEKKARAEALSEQDPDPQPKAPPVRIEEHGPWLPITSHRTLHACWKMQTFASDVFICSYPKPGTTWMQNIAAQIITQCERKKNGATGAVMKFKHISEVAPFLEIDPHWNHDRLDDFGRPMHTDALYENFEKFERRTYNTHLPFELVPGKGKVGEIFLPWETWAHKPGVSVRPRYVYVVGTEGLRGVVLPPPQQPRPEDGGYAKGWNAFFDEWIEGKIAFGAGRALKVGQVPGVRPGRARGQVRGHEKQPEGGGETRRHARAGRPVPGFRAGPVSHSRSMLVRPNEEGCRFQPKSVRWSNPDYCFLRKGRWATGGDLHRGTGGEVPEEDRRGVWIRQICKPPTAAAGSHGRIGHRGLGRGVDRHPRASDRAILIAACRAVVGQRCDVESVVLFV